MTNPAHAALSWETVRNRSWQEQERFVSDLIERANSYQYALEFLRDEKYSASWTFKHLFGNVREYINDVLSGTTKFRDQQ